MDIPKGQIIEVLMKKIRFKKDVLESKIKPQQTENKVKEVATTLTKEIQEMPLTYQVRPPDEFSLLESQTAHPPLLDEFLNMFLTTRYSRDSIRKERIKHLLYARSYIQCNQW